MASLLSRPVPPAGVVAASGGNHGLAGAFAARKLGIPARIFVSSAAAITKRERIREMGELIIAAERRCPTHATGLRPPAPLRPPTL